MMGVIIDYSSFPVEMTHKEVNNKHTEDTKLLPRIHSISTVAIHSELDNTLHPKNVVEGESAGFSSLFLLVLALLISIVF